ncbi:hypothetical protein N9Y16_02605 [Gammaproteobacteria bacterium]|nr:hypothetical protein [Gammaproteobacteria bacterium]
MANILGTSGDDELTGTPAGDQIYGYAGDDILRGNAGNDSLYGGAGNNTLYGGEGNDYLWVADETGNNRLFGDAGNDFITGGSGADFLEGGTGDDRLTAGSGDDTLAGQAGDDRLLAGAGNDTITTGSGVDLVYAGEGDDTVNAVFTDISDPRLVLTIDPDSSASGGSDAVTAYGEAGADLLYGSQGDDWLDGGLGNDWLFGGAGNDTLVSGGGGDVLHGGEGDDTYTVSEASVWLEDSAGDDTVVVQASWVKIPASIETRNYAAAAKPLPYWLDAMLADGAAWISSLVGTVGATNTNTYSYGFPSAAPSYYTDADSIERDLGKVAGWQAFNAQQKAFTEQALAVVSAVADVTFVATDAFDQLNTLAFATNSQWSTRAQFAAPTASFAASDVLINRFKLGSEVLAEPAVAAPQTASFEASLWLRAIGGALGLKTPTSEAATFASETPVAPFLSVEIDIEQAFRRQLALYSPLAGEQETLVLSRMLDGANGSEAFEHSLALGVLDIAALHYLYGPNPSRRAGDDIYTLNTARANFIWDGGGFDTLDASGSLLPVTLYLSPGYWGYVGDAAGASIIDAGQQTINFGTRIEKVIGSAMGDTLVGDEFDNWLVGAAGSDKLDGGAGIDTALILAPRATTTLTRLNDGLADAQWQLRRGTEVDNLTGVERVEFSDYGLALDLDGNAGEAVKLLGVLIGADSLSDRGLVAAVLDYADTGLSLEAMLTIGLDLLLGESPSGVAVVNLLHQALTGVEAGPALLADYGGRIDRGEMSAVELALLAAETDLNSANLDLVGLSSNGLAYALGTF